MEQVEQPVNNGKGKSALSNITKSQANFLPTSAFLSIEVKMRLLFFQISRKDRANLCRYEFKQLRFTSFH